MYRTENAADARTGTLLEGEMTFEAIDHGILSPSGRMSNRAVRSARKRESERLQKAWAAEAAQTPAPELSRLERLQIAASGHPDLASTQAARRVLARMAA